MELRAPVNIDSAGNAVDSSPVTAVCQAARVTVPDAHADLARFSPLLLATEGMVLREWRLQDLPLMVELFDDSEIARWTPLPTPFTLGDAEERLAGAHEPDRLQLAVTTDGEAPLGEVLLTGPGELGYSIGARHRGQGLAARALVLLRDWAHEVVGLEVLWLRIAQGNGASAAIAARTGFRPTRPASEIVDNKGRSCTIDVWEHTS